MLDFPNTPAVGDTLELDGIVWVWDGVKWSHAEGASTGTSIPRISTGEFPPANPSSGDLWFDPTEGQLYIYFHDGTSAQWVVTINQGGGGGGGIEEAPTDGNSYVRRGSDQSWLLQPQITTHQNITTTPFTLTAGFTGMLGAGASITPMSTGRLLVLVTHWCTSGFIVGFRYGIGTAPLRGNTDTGISTGATWNVTTVNSTFMLFDLSVGSTYWADLCTIGAVSAASTVNRFTIVAIEI